MSPVTAILQGCKRKHSLLNRNLVTIKGKYRIRGYSRVAKRRKTANFPRDWRLSHFDFDFYKIQYYLSRSRLNAILFVLEYLS